MMQRATRYTPLYSNILNIGEVGERIWHNPEDNCLYLGTSNGQPTYGYKVRDLNQYVETRTNFKAGKETDAFKVMLAGIPEEMHEQMKKYYSLFKAARQQNFRDIDKFVENHVFGAAILRREDFSTLHSMKISSKILGATPKKHIVMDLVTVENTSDFATKIYTAGNYYDIVFQNLPELGIPPVFGFPGFTSQTYGLERMGWNQAYSEEFLMETYDVNIKDWVEKNASIQFDIVKNKKMADIINAASTTAGSLWTAKTGLYHDNDPAVDIDAVMNAYQGTDQWEGGLFASNRTVYNAYFRNTNISKYTTPNFTTTPYSYGNVIKGGVPEFEGLRWGIDSFFTAQKLFAIDPAAVVAINGPTFTVQYRSPMQDYRGTMNKIFFKGVVLDAAALKAKSGLTS